MMNERTAEMENGYRVMFRFYWLELGRVEVAARGPSLLNVYKTYSEALTALNNVKLWEHEQLLEKNAIWSVERWIEPL